MTTDTEIDRAFSLSFVESVNMTKAVICEKWVGLYALIDCEYRDGTSDRLFAWGMHKVREANESNPLLTPAELFDVYQCAVKEVAELRDIQLKARKSAIRFEVSQ
jgi:hypothetical protein